mgnify:CR=1 FL=1
MSFKKLMTYCLFAMILLLGAGCGDSSESDGDSGASGNDSITLKIAHTGSDTHQYNIASEKFKELVESKSDTIKVEIHGNATLGSEADAIEQVMDGTLEMTTVAPDSSLANTIEEMQLFGLPFIFKDRDHVYSVLDGEIGDELLSFVEKANMVGLGWWEIGFRHVTNSRKEIIEPDDMEGLKIRVQPSPVWEVHMTSLGANPTPVNFDELYSALDQGLVDGQENPLPTIDSMKFYEVQDYVALTAHAYTPAIVVINKDLWENRLTDEQREVIQEAVDETTRYIRTTLEEMENEIMEKLENEGVTITEPDREKFRERTKDVPSQVDGIPEEIIERIQEEI